MFLQYYKIIQYIFNISMKYCKNISQETFLEYFSLHWCNIPLKRYCNILLNTPTIIHLNIPVIFYEKNTAIFFKSISAILKKEYSIDITNGSSHCSLETSKNIFNILLKYLCTVFSNVSTKSCKNYLTSKKYSYNIP